MWSGRRLLQIHKGCRGCTLLMTAVDHRHPLVVSRLLSKLGPDLSTSFEGLESISMAYKNAQASNLWDMTIHLKYVTWEGQLSGSSTHEALLDSLNQAFAAGDIDAYKSLRSKSHRLLPRGKSRLA